jgi:hypothetical protein
MALMDEMQETRHRGEPKVPRSDEDAKSEAGFTLEHSGAEQHGSDARVVSPSLPRLVSERRDCQWT